jgi:pyridoxine 5-phosphate synthase
MKLGVNIDHVATIRQARYQDITIGQHFEPDPVRAASLAESGGADSIVVHLREDRRHIQDRDLRVLRETVTVKLNLELAASPDIVAIACHTRPDQATLVPEKREEVTTEGGLDLFANPKRVADAIAALRGAGIEISLFIDPDLKQIDEAARLKADAVELHTGEYAMTSGEQQAAELAKLAAAARHAKSRGLILHAGHGLTYRNVKPIAALEGISELNIGHSIVARALMVGFEQAVREMKKLVE